MAQYVLYAMEGCPFCRKVHRFMEANGIENVEVKDIHADPANEDYLIEHGGKDQVPCLFIDGQPLYESETIIQYFKDHLLQGEATDVADDEGDKTCPF